MDYKVKSEDHFLEKKAEEAGWTRLGHVRQDTRWLPKTGANVSKPHVYEEEYDIKRFMRWIASYLSAKYNIGSEVQCYYDIRTRRILVAANKDSDISTLASQISTRLLRLFLLEVAFEPFPIGSGKTVKELTKRQIRHGKKLSRLSDMAMISKGIDLSKVRLCVVPRISDVDSLHAEQRILHYLRGEAEDESLMLQPQLLGGIKRPCFVCAHACFAPGDRANVHPGLLWDTKSATCKLEQSAIEDIVGAMQDEPKVYRTWASKAGAKRAGAKRVGAETEEIDSESEDEADFYPRLLGKL